MGSVAPDQPRFGPAGTDAPPVVTEGEAIDVRRWQTVVGVWVDVPLNFNAVMVLRGDGRMSLLPGGRHRVFPTAPGLYQLFLVDMRDRMTPVHAAANAADTWRVALDVEVWWRVANPARVRSFYPHQPAERIRAAGREIMRELIQRMPHDQLVGGEGRPISAQSITNEIHKRLAGSRAIPGIQIVSVVLVNTTRDEQRQALLQRARAQEAQIQTDLLLEKQQSEFIKARIDLRTDVADREQALTLKEQQYALDRDLAQRLARVEFAKVDVATDAYVQQKARQGIETDNERQLLALEQQRFLETQRYRAETTKAFMQAISQALVAQGMAAPLDPVMATIVANVFQMYLTGVPGAPFSQMDGAGERRSGKPDGQKAPGGKEPSGDGYFSKLARN
jgi:hypothetical protein